MKTVRRDSDQSPLQYLCYGCKFAMVRLLDLTLALTIIVYVLIGELLFVLDRWEKSIPEREEKSSDAVSTDDCDAYCP